MSGLHDLHGRREARRGRRTTTPCASRATSRRRTCSMPPAAVPILPEHVWSKIPPKAAASSYANKPPIVGSGSFQCVEFKKSGFVRMVGQQGVLARGAADRRGPVRVLCEPGQHGVGSRGGDDRRLLRTDVPAEQKAAGRLDITVRAFVVNGYDDLVMNCYAAGKSLGNPVLRDWRFRQALQWAVDKEKLTQVVYYGIARPGDTVITPGYSTDPDWHWSPPASQAYAFDLERARQLLDAAGYRDTNDDGIRDYRGEPIKLRLWAMSEYATSQAEVKLIAGWFRQLGLKIDVATMPMARHVRPDLQRGRRPTRARLRPLPVGLLPRPRPGPEPQLLHLRADRRLERLGVLRRGVRPALRGTGSDTGQGAAQAARRPHAADRLRAVALHRARLLRRRRGLARRVGRLGRVTGEDWKRALDRPTPTCSCTPRPAAETADEESSLAGWDSATGRSSASPRSVGGGIVLRRRRPRPIEE